MPFVAVAQASDVLMVASDALVLLMTWTKTRKIQKEAESMDLQLKLYMLLLRDGTLTSACPG